MAAIMPEHERDSQEFSVPDTRDASRPRRADPLPQPPQGSPRAGDGSETVHGVVCKQCAYDLSGLDGGGMCPECGLPIERSLTDDLLEHSSPAYLTALHKGVVLVLAAIIIKLILVIGGIAIGMALSLNQVNPTLFIQINYGLDFLASIMLATGWWMFSAPDPAYTGRLDGSTARQIVRITIVIVAGIAAVVLPMRYMTINSTTGALVLIVGVLGFISLVAWATGFFAAMLYIRWLAPRIPDRRAFNRAKMLMWAGPLLYTVGTLCVGLGPLVALILYWNMLDWIRKDLKEIRREQQV